MAGKSNLHVVAMTSSSIRPDRGWGAKALAASWALQHEPRSEQVKNASSRHPQSGTPETEEMTMQSQSPTSSSSASSHTSPFLEFQSRMRTVDQFHGPRYCLKLTIETYPRCTSKLSPQYQSPETNLIYNLMLSLGFRPKNFPHTNMGV